MTCQVNAKDCIRQGETYNLSYSVVGVSDLTDWTCYLQVRVASTCEETAISREITTTNTENDKFITTLTSAETGALTPGSYVVGAELENTATGELGEILLDLDVHKQWVVKP